MRTSHKILKWILGLMILAVVIVLAVLFFAGQKGNQYTEEIARTQDIVTYYTFSGNLEPGDAQVVYATGRGTVKELLKQEGDLVEDEEAVLQPKSGSKIESTMDGTISDIYVKADDAYTAGDELFRVDVYKRQCIHRRGEVCLPAYFAAFCAQERDKIVLSFAMSCA